MIVVSDTSPLVYFAAIGHAELLPKLYGRVTAPPSVRAEIAAGMTAMPNNRQLLDCPWLEFLPVRDAAQAARWATEVDAGEAEAIELALELKADLVLMDDMDGRELAQRQGLRVVGLLGALIDAKRAGHLVAVSPVMEMLERQTNFRLSPALRSMILKAAGE